MNKKLLLSALTFLAIFPMVMPAFAKAPAQDKNNST
jgi:hypothetical protein